MKYYYVTIYSSNILVKEVFADEFGVNSIINKYNLSDIPYNATVNSQYSLIKSYAFSVDEDIPKNTPIFLLKTIPVGSKVLYKEQPKASLRWLLNNPDNITFTTDSGLNSKLAFDEAKFIVYKKDAFYYLIKFS